MKENVSLLVTTKQLILCFPMCHDESDISEIYADQDVRDAFGITTDIKKLIVEAWRDWETLRHGLVALKRKTDDRVVGIVKFQQSPLSPPRGIEVLYATHPTYRGNGLMVEGLSAILSYICSRGAYKFVAIIGKQNKASAGVAKSVGFKRGKDRPKGKTRSQREWVYEFPPHSL